MASSTAAGRQPRRDPSHRDRRTAWGCLDLGASLLPSPPERPSRWREGRSSCRDEPHTRPFFNRKENHSQSPALSGPLVPTGHRGPTRRGRLKRISVSRGGRGAPAEARVPEAGAAAAVPRSEQNRAPEAPSQTRPRSPGPHAPRPAESRALPRASHRDLPRPGAKPAGAPGLHLGRLRDYDSHKARPC